ncbi:hypothetical protein WG29040_23390 [Pseudomonas sp. PAMC 29040]|uniref:hypothetical protein n=1 Tax=Pseudomonas sp. PAMC 29040 TaxID=2498450 RepID=UPI000FB01BF1|nr:hypothetical protein [Pseudomonas sp. PAMC 29040]RUT30886.1 hypothetical protein WG29040_23390 [Pseudomonas sp. PAMC 29040]
MRVQVFVGLAMLALAGCAVQSPELRTVRVEIPVQVPCRTKNVEVPVFATDSLKKTDPLEAKVRALLAERLQRQAYEIKLLAAVTACQ